VWIGGGAGGQRREAEVLREKAREKEDKGFGY
jgi:hypothetical protein